MKKSAGMWLTLGVLFLLLFGFGIAIGVAYAFGFPYYDGNILPVLGGVCVPTALIPGIIFVALGMKARRKEQSLMEFASWVKSYRRVALAEVARKLGKSEFETDKILVEVVDRGLVAGFIDRQTNEFVLKEEIGRQQYVEACSRCGASLKKMYPLGETVLCPYCGSVILAPPTPQAPPSYPPPPTWPPPPPYGPPPYSPPPQGPGYPPRP